jgi:sirohydrochlorin cobaltochelatase
MDSAGIALGVVLLAHGSSNSETDAEAKRLGSALALQRPEWAVAVAYLNGTPSLGQAVAWLKERGSRRISVSPLLVFTGKHVREDIPSILAAERSRHPETPLTLLPHLSALPGFPQWLAQELDQAASADPGA